ncbi:carbohydrate-binding domain-containing protein, partial [Ruminococcaceae bacterium OttesenSCG-928-I18]|nr:carbohydrate-binding domain-containing protein [Ruminococcaceae bacterium OttesenSCG-928-I18]
MIIQHNIMSVNAHRQLGVNNTALSKRLGKLSSGYRINVAADDAAGLAISEKMRAQITGLGRAVLNSHDGVSLVQTAEGALQEVHVQLNRLEELAVQAANGIYGADDRQKLQAETDALLEECNRISQATNFNSIKLLDGSLSKNSGIANAAVAQAPPPYATPMALSAMSALGLEGAGEAMGIQPLGGGIGTLSTETIYFETLQEGDEGTGWRFSGGVLTISGDGNNYVINGTQTQTTNRIKVDSNTNCGITLNNVNINTSVGPAMDTRGATVRLNLEGKNKLVATTQFFAGLQTSGGDLTIDGTGELSTASGNFAAGIGGGRWGTCGKVTINGGTIYAKGGAGGAGIGGGDAAGGTINITGGTIYATGGMYGAGIGGGAGGSGGNITITGGTVTATATEDTVKG